jgi:hypothetical protein
VNPHAIEAFKTFWTVLTHNRPIFKDVAVAWCWPTGFEQVYALFFVSNWNRRSQTGSVDSRRVRRYCQDSHDPRSV